MNKKFIQVLTRLKAAKFKPMPLKGALNKENLSQMQENLWSMFKIKYSKAELEKFHSRKKSPFGANVADYAWTEAVKKQFYEHPYHAKLVKAMHKANGMTWGMWVLQCEPTDYSEELVAARTPTTRSKMNSLMRDIAWELHPMNHESILEKYWDLQEEKPRIVPVHLVTEPVLRFVIDYLYMMVTQGETVTLSEMKKEAASLVRTAQEDLFGLEEGLKRT